MKVEVRNLCVAYGARQVLKGVSLDLVPGRMLGVVGPNGSGKSTMVKALAGQVGSQGALRFDGLAERPASIGYMPQDTASAAALTVLEAVLLGRLGRLRLRVAAEDLEAVQQMLDRLDIAPLASRYLGELSGGQRQMVFLAQALAGEPTVLLLDEPISALDVRHQLEVLEVVGQFTRERKLSTLIVLHDLNAALRFSDEVLVLAEGRVEGLGEPGQVLSTGCVARVFGVEAERLLCSDGRPVLAAQRALSDAQPRCA